MNRNFQIQKLKDLICSEWEAKSIAVHNRIVDIRALLNLLGQDFFILDTIAVEIETISGVAIGVGDEYLTHEDQLSLKKQIFLLKNNLSKITEI